MSDGNVIIEPSAHRVTGASDAPPIRARIEPIRPSRAGPELLVSISPPLAATLSPVAAPTHGDACSGVALQVHSDLDAAKSEWKAFETGADCTVFQTFDWLAKWQAHVGSRNGTIPAVVFGRDPDGQLLLVLPLAIETRGPVRRLAWLGSVLCDYNAPLLARHFSDRFDPDRFPVLWREVVELLRTDPRLGFDLVDLQKMPETIGEQRNPFLDLEVLANPSGAHIASLGGNWEQFYAAKRSASTRKRERRQFKQLAEHGDARFVVVQDRQEIERTLDTLFTQKAHSFARMGVEDIFARPGYKEFFLDITTDPGLREMAHVSRLDVGAIAAAAGLGLRFRTHYYLVLSSYQEGELSRFGPGRAHLHELLRCAIDRGFRRFDFTIGDEAYKSDWSDIELKIYDYLAANTIRGRLVVATIVAFRRTKRFIKQTPALWRAFSKARTLAGAWARARGGGQAGS